MEEIILEVWGDFACFSDPAGGKVERLSYPFPTPSAVRGILSAIYSKPPEFFWQINRIEVLNPIRYISFKRNEIKSTVRDKPIYTDEDRTQRQTFSGTAEQLCRQALRRIRNGKTYFQPSLGLREFVAYFEESDGIKEPIPVDMDAGLMVYDVFDPHDSDSKG